MDGAAGRDLRTAAGTTGPAQIGRPAGKGAGVAQARRRRVFRAADSPVESAAYGLRPRFARTSRPRAGRARPGFQNPPGFRLRRFRPGPDGGGLAFARPQIAGQLSVFPPALRRADAEAAHPVARLAYALALYLNPNNHALDGGRASSALEKEAVREIAAMFGWTEALGHLTGGGTMANLEALWVAGQLQPGKTILASEQAHYTHSRISSVLRLPFEEISCDARGRMDMAALAGRVARGDVGTVVATLGTTATGSVDPLADILRLREKFGFRVHADAAYGGYFVLASNLGREAAASFRSAGEADSLVIDPHKHGLQPYGCGCVLFRDPGVGRLYKHDSPYTYFSSAELHLGEISLECSRPGAAAAALWATQKLLPLERGGGLARGLEKGRQAALEFWDAVESGET